MSCELQEQVERLHDGELSPAERRDAELHMKSCPECSRTLAELRSLSALLQQAEPAAMAPDLARRLHVSMSARLDRGVLQTTGWLTAAAAAILIVALLRTPQTSTASDAPPAWEALAMGSPVETREALPSDPTTAAQWMADEFSSTNGDLQ